MERMAVNEGEKNTLYIVDRKAVDKCRKGKRIWVKHKREEKKKMKMLFRVRVTDEQRDELMWLKWMQRDWRSVCCVNGHEDKELLWLLWKLCPSNAQTSKAKLAPVCTSECVREKERKNSCGMRAKCLAFLPPLSVACSLIPMMCLDLIYPHNMIPFCCLQTLRRLKKKTKTIKLPHKRGKAK